MKNLLVNKKVTINAVFDSKQWGINKDAENTDDIVDKLNTQLEFYVNSGYERKDVYDKMASIVLHHNRFLLKEATPLTFLEKVITEIYS